jgi:DNA replication and repair protein RecF
MYVQRLSLTNLRTYARLELELQARVHILQGSNAQGKTNLLEALYFLATTRSPLASTERELIRWAANDDVIPYARAEATFVRAGQTHTLETTLVLEPQENGAPDKSLRRQIRLDGSPRRALDVVGQLNVVLFLPQDIALVAGAPGERRRYLDVTLCQIDPTYCRSLSRYGRVLTQRNALLHAIREHRAGPAELDYWDAQLSECGAYVLARRRWAVSALDPLVDDLQRTLTDGAEGLHLTYQSSVPADDAGSADGAAAFRRALRAARREELARAVTVVGPHRDDLRYALNGMDATVYGSRGQQRTVALGLKLAEMALMASQTGEMPVLLLDDVASELDARRCALLLEHISAAEQVLLTTTDLHVLPAGFAEKAVLWRVAGGQVRPADTL